MEEVKFMKRQRTDQPQQLSPVLRLVDFLSARLHSCYRDSILPEPARHPTSRASELHARRSPWLF